MAVYGTLAPGRINHHQLAAMRGQWIKGKVRGALVPQGWGAAVGHPGLHLSAFGPVVEVDLFESPDLPANWQRLDAFEGDGYRRAITQVSTDDGDVEAWIYVLSNSPGS